MANKKLIIAISLLIWPIFSFSQSEFDRIDFSKVDSFARTVTYENDLFKLTNDLTEPYSKAIFKVRSIFVWITDNIKYDYEFINKEKETILPDCSGKIDCNNEIREWENGYLKSVLKKRKAICFGYSRLFKRMCDIAKIECDIIDGYTKQEPYQIGIPLSVNHAWNAIRIDGLYYFLDPTWAAGYCTKDEESGRLLDYVKKYNNYYWLTPFDKLVKNHYPKNGRWVMRENFTKEKFFNSPYYSSSVIPDIELITPNSGIIATRQCDTIHFKIRYDSTIRRLQINSNLFRNPSLYTETKISKKRTTYNLDTFALRKQIYIPFERELNTYTFDYVVLNDALYYIELVFDYRKVMRFKVNVSANNKPL